MSNETIESKLSSTIEKLSSKYGACSDAIAWLEESDASTPQEAWDKCERGDWMLWLLGRLSGPVGSESRKKLVKASVACARLVLPIYAKKYPKDNRVAHCLDVTEAYTEGRATLDEVKKATAYAYAAADAAADAAAYAAAAYAAAAAAYAAYAAAAAEAAYAAAYAAAAARNKRLKDCANVVRKFYPKAPTL